MSVGLSSRCLRGLQIANEGKYLNNTYYSDPYDAKNNPTGFVRLSCADNVLTEDVILEKYRSIDPFKFVEQQLLYYIIPGGRPETLQAFADLINDFSVPNLKTPVKPEELAIIAGTTMVFDLLGQVLFDEGDVLLAHSPYYHRFPNDFSDRNLIDIVDVPIIVADKDDVVLNVEDFEAKRLESVKQNKKVKALLIVNPRNPDGGYFTLQELKPLINWAVKEHGLYVILDEIYDLAIYDPIDGAPFESALRLFDADPTLDRNKIIWTSGLSKNFSLPGLRTAVMYTPNVEVLDATRRFLMLQGPASVVEFIAREFITDQKWIREIYLPINLSRLKAARDFTVDWLQRLKIASKKNVAWITPRAGFFVMINFRVFLTSLTFDGEQELQQRLIDHKVLIVRGAMLTNAVPGWFRIVFSCRQLEDIKTGLDRISLALLGRVV